MKNPFILLTFLLIFFSCTPKEPLINEIQKIEFERSKIRGVFDKFLIENNADVYRQIAISVARIQDSVHIDVLNKLLLFDDSSVIKTSIFALGQIGNSTCRNLLTDLFINTKYDTYKAEILRALGRIKGEETVKYLIDQLPVLNDSLSVAAIMGISFQTEKADRKKTGQIIDSYLDSENTDIRAAAAYYFSRHPYSRSVSHLLDTRLPEGSVADKYRLKAIDKGMTSYLISIWDSIMVDSLRNDLIWQLNNREITWQNKLQLISVLSQIADSVAVDKIAVFLQNDNPHLRNKAITSLGKHKTIRVKNMLLNHYNDATWQEKGEIIIVLAQTDRHLAYRLIQQNLDQGTTYFKQQLLSGLGIIKDRASIRQLRQFLIVPNVRLNLAAFIELDQLNLISYEDVQPFLQSGDVILTTIGAGWVAEHPDRGNLTDLINAYKKFKEPQGLDAMQTILEAISIMDDPEAVTFLQESLPLVKSSVLAVPIEQMLDKFGIDKYQEPVLSDRLFVPDTLISPDADVTVLLTTSRGEIQINLRPDLAPATVANFLYLVKKGYYNNLIFHRVISDFVIQSGDPLGTGWGGPGYSIPCEYSPAPFIRGTVGMATAGKDTGGSQFFICHSEQPHLTGRYTVFGQVVSGMEVVDQIQIDDTIKQITILN